MNRILIAQSEFAADGSVTLTDQRAHHIREVLRTPVGGTIATGTIDGLCGRARLLEVTPTRVRLLPNHTTAAPPPWFDLLLAAPRPKVLKRLWPQLAALGVGHVVIIRAATVEKCYFSSQWLQPQHYRPLLIEGLTQSGTTALPRVTIAPRFKPFIEDSLDTLFPDSLRLLAHPGKHHWPPQLSGTTLRPLLAIGPEGGWTDFEVALLQEYAFLPCALGFRTLRSDTACIALIAALEQQIV